MAIDPSIPLSIRPQQQIALPPIQSPLDRYQKMLTLRHLMQQGQLGQMNIEQTRLENEALQRTARDEQSLGSWMQQNQQRPDLTPQDIVKSHPNPTGIKFATAWSAQQTAALTQRKAVLDAAHEEAKTDDRIYNSVFDDDSKLAALTELVKLKRIDGTMASHLAAIPFDSPEFKGIQQRAAAQSLDRLQRITAAKDEIDLRIAKATETSRTEGAIAEGTSKTLDAAQKQKASDAAMVAAAFDQSDAAGAAVLATLAKDPKRLEPFRNVTTAAEARQVGLTVEQQAVGERAKTSAEAQLWSDPGGLIAIRNDPNRRADWPRAEKGLELHEKLRRAGAMTVAVSPNQMVGNESALRQDYTTATKEYVTIRNAYSKISSAAKAATAVGDMSLVFGLMKLQDANSTVRESEQASARNAAGVPEIVRNTWNRLLTGESLTPAQREDMVARAREIYDQSYADYGKTKEMYTGIATRYGMNPNNVVIDLSPATPATPAGQKKYEKGSDPGGLGLR